MIVEAWMVVTAVQWKGETYSHFYHSRERAEIELHLHTQCWMQQVWVNEEKTTWSD